MWAPPLWLTAFRTQASGGSGSSQIWPSIILDACFIQKVLLLLCPSDTSKVLLHLEGGSPGTGSVLQLFWLAWICFLTLYYFVDTSLAKNPTAARESNKEAVGSYHGVGTGFKSQIWFLSSKVCYQSVDLILGWWQLHKSMMRHKLKCYFSIHVFVKLFYFAYMWLNNLKFAFATIGLLSITSFMLSNKSHSHCCAYLANQQLIVIYTVSPKKRPPFIFPITLSKINRI